MRAEAGRFSLGMDNMRAEAGRDGQTCLLRPNSQVPAGTGINDFSLFS